jgi:hypothetical protein
VALAACLPILIFVIWSAAAEVPDFFNPCFQWGAGNSGIVILTPQCPSAGGSSQPLSQAILVLALVQGGIIAGVATGLLGILLARPTFMKAGFVVLVLESTPLLFDGFFVFTLLPALFFLYSAKSPRGL